jgi:carbamoyl-phosphate synthase small subunit
VSATSFGAPVSAAGEVVFTTGMVGYPESLTDPSYRGQILTLTFPSAGNYGVPPDAVDEHGLPRIMESERVQIAGLIVADYHPAYSHWQATRSLGAWLVDAGVPAVCNVDTRALTRRLRAHGTMPGKIIIGEEPPRFDPAEHDLVPVVGRGRPDPIGPAGGPHIVVVDCGVKANILRCLVERGARCTVIPWDQDPTPVPCDGILYTNGPGDPDPLRGQPSTHLKRAFAEPRHPHLRHLPRLPAPGARRGSVSSFKLRFGHRGQNQPVIDTTTRNAAT